jgi:2-haloacid dehalogenase
MLPTALVMSVSRRNAIVWDAIISCEMIGVYKPHAEAYASAARWMGLEPGHIRMVACHNFDLDAAHAALLSHRVRAPPRRVGSRGPAGAEPEQGLRLRRDGVR